MGGIDYTACLYELLEIGGDTQAVILAPRNGAAGNHDSEWIDMSGYCRALFILVGGAANDGAAVLNAEVRQATDNVGGGPAKALAGVRGAKAITAQLAGGGFAGRNDLWLIEVRAEEMDVNNGFEFLGIRVNVSTGDTWYIAATVLRSVAAYEPVANAQATIVD